MTTLKGVFPDPKPIKRKDFIHENVKNVRRIEQCYTNKEIDEIQKLRLHEHKSIGNKYQNVQSKMNSNLQVKKYKGNNVIVNNKIEQKQKLCKKSNSSMLNKTTVSAKNMLHSTSNNNSPVKQKKKECKSLHKSVERLHEKVLSDPNLSCESSKHVDDDTKIQTKFRSQGIQTLDTKEMDNLYSEGMIRYPSKKCLNNYDSKNKNEPNQLNDKALRDATNTPLDQGDVKDLHKNIQNKTNLRSSELFSSKGELDVTKLNKKHISVASKVTTRLNNNNNNNSNIPPNNYRKGVVPKYLKNRKEAQEKEQKAKEEVLDPDCPNGHVQLPDQERKETLHILKKNYQDYVNELNMMPIKSDTLRAQQRKTEIEKQLNKLEEGIKVFSKPKVYVKLNA
ncbi:flap endonuclease 1 [Colletes gigas]|uniref:flap endonuclease 1 n=1 Tax=Colletes gigas TaxID=935657 RepID=UPI001C9B5208|nr:flap endonuclease 1 [Colletes gigas]